MALAIMKLLSVYGRTEQICIYVDYAGSQISHSWLGVVQIWNGGRLGKR